MNLINHLYRLNETEIADEGGITHLVYGIDAVTACGRILNSYKDIFFDRLKAEKFVSFCNEMAVELMHLPHVVEDALAEQYTVLC